jgi:hypothetical protein
LLFFTTTGASIRQNDDTPFIVNSLTMDFEDSFLVDFTFTGTTTSGQSLSEGYTVSNQGRHIDLPDFAGIQLTKFEISTPTEIWASIDDFNVTIVPEPTCALLLGSVILLAALWRKWFKSSSLP